MIMQKIIAYVSKLSFALKSCVKHRSSWCVYAPPSVNNYLNFSCNIVNHHISTIKENNWMICLRMETKVLLEKPLYREQSQVGVWLHRLQELCALQADQNVQWSFHLTSSSSLLNGFIYFFPNSYKESRSKIHFLIIPVLSLSTRIFVF